MKAFLRYSGLIIFLAIGLFSVMITSTRSDFDDFLDQYYSFIYLLFFVFSAILILLWFQHYKVVKSRYALIPIFLPVALLLGMVGISIYQSWRKNIPAFLRAGVEGFSIELRENGTYRINSSGEFSSDSYYGDFSMNKDTITLKQVPLTSGKFLLVLNKSTNSRPFGILREIDDKRKEGLFDLPISSYNKNNR